MTGDHDLFTYPQTAGWTDPHTSQDAADSIDAGTLRAIGIDALEHFGPMTSDECAGRLGRNILSIRPRFTELKAMNPPLIFETGERRPDRRALAQDDPLLDSAAPMRWRAALLPEEGAELELPEYYGPLDRARAYVHAGRYKRAIHELTGKDAPDAEAGLVLAEANLRLGRYDEAAAAVDDPAEPAAVVMAARIEMERGQSAKAAQRLDAHLAHEPVSLHARLWRARIAEESGDLETAVAHYRWFVDQRYLQAWARDPDDRRFESAEDVVAIATALDRYATIQSEYRADATLHTAILGMFVRA